MFTNPDKSMLFMLLAIMSWFIAWNAIEAFYSTYVSEVFLPDIDAEEAAGQASQVLFIFPIVFVVFTIVGGIMGTRMGRRITMRIGLFFMTVAIILASLIDENSFLGIDMGWKTSFTIIFVLAGAAWGLVNVNSIVVIWHHATDNGTGTGLYYAFASAAAILGPTMVGVLMDIEVTYLFPFSITFLVIALIFLFMVKTGEVGDDVHGEDKFLGEALGEMVD
jgi:MFS family permease